MNSFLLLKHIIIQFSIAHANNINILLMWFTTVQFSLILSYIIFSYGKRLSELLWVIVLKEKTTQIHSLITEFTLTMQHIHSNKRASRYST